MGTVDLLVCLGISISVGMTVFSYIMYRKYRVRGRWIQYPDGREVRDLPEGKLFRIIVSGKCPDCNHQGFYAGPQGGMSTNIFCMNRECRSGFNVTPFPDGGGIAERIHQGDIRQYPTTQ